MSRWRVDKMIQSTDLIDPTSICQSIGRRHRTQDLHVEPHDRPGQSIPEIHSMYKWPQDYMDTSLSQRLNSDTNLLEHIATRQPPQQAKQPTWPLICLNPESYSCNHLPNQVFHSNNKGGLSTITSDAGTGSNTYIHTIPITSPPTLLTIILPFTAPTSIM